MILGIILGMLASILIILGTRRFQTPIERITKRVENFTKEKGEVFTPREEDEDFQHFINNLPRDGT